MRKILQLFTIVVAMLICTASIFLSASALSDNQIDKTKEVTLTIHTKATDESPISEVGYTIYLVSTDVNDIPNISDLDKDKLKGVELPKTEKDGKSSITLKAEQQGIYLVSCTRIPSTVSKAQDDFLVSLPFTLDGEKWEYTVEVSPKLVLAEQPTQSGSIQTTGIGSGITTNGNGNGLETNGVKATINTGGVAACICIPIGIIFLSVGIVFVVKSKKFSEKN